MKILVLGSGEQGYAVAVDLLRETDVGSVTLADIDVERLDATWARIGDRRLAVVRLDAAEPASLRPAFDAHEVVLSAVPARFNPGLAQVAIDARRSFVDLGGDPEALGLELALDEAAREAGIAILPDQGLAPGLVNVLAADLADLFDRCDAVRIRYGALPVRPVGPLGYRVVSSVDGLLDGYCGEEEVLRGGARVRVPALSETEPFELPPPFGAGEAGVTRGALSTMAATFEGRIETLDCKAIRFPGHFEKFRLMAAIGLLDGAQQETGVPRRVLAAAIGRSCAFPDVPDMVIVRVTAEGVVEGERRRIVVETLDFGEPAKGITATMRMTAFPAAAVARRLARRDLELAGAFPPERSISWDDLRADLEGRGVSFTRREKVVLPRGSGQ